MSKILEKIIEPSKIEIGSNFLLKIKAIRYLIYREVKQKSYGEIKSFTYKEMKGD